MVYDKLINKGFKELSEETEQIKNLRTIKHGVQKLDGSPIFIIPYADFKGWGTRIANFVERVFGKDSIHHQEFIKIFTKNRGDIDAFEACRAIFYSAKKDYESGYLFNIRGLAKAEVLDDILEQAKELLDSGYKDAACVLIGISLETTLKELSKREGTPLGNINKMNSALQKADVYNMAKQKQITAWADLRNKAAHGEWSEYHKKDVEYYYQGVQAFVADYL